MPGLFGTVASPLTGTLRHRWMGWLVLCALWLAGCAQPMPSAPVEENSWNGRIALQIDGQAS